MKIKIFICIAAGLLVSQNVYAAVIKVYPTDYLAQFAGVTYDWYDAANMAEIDQWVVTGNVHSAVKTAQPVQIAGVPQYPILPALLEDAYLGTWYFFEIPGNTQGLWSNSVFHIISLDLEPTGFGPADQAIYDTYREKYLRRQAVMDQHMSLVQTYFGHDNDNIQAAIDNARPGDTIRLQPGIFRLARYGAEDVQITTAAGPFLLSEDFWERARADFPAVDVNWKGLRWGIWDSHININKAYLTIRGQESADGPNPTIITHMNPWVSGGIDTYLNGDTQKLIINAPHVTIRDIRFDGMIETIHAYHAGFAIRDNWMVDCGFGLYLTPDAASTYPYYPDLSVPIESTFVGNQMINCGQAPHVVGSEMKLRNNYFDMPHGTIGLALLTWGMQSRGTSFFAIPELPINFEHLYGNEVVDNIIDMAGAGAAVWIANWFGGDSKDNVIRNNVITNCDNDDGIWIYSASPLEDVRGSSGHMIKGNLVENCGWPLGLNAYRGDSIEGVVVSDNVVINSLYDAALYLYERPFSGGTVKDNVIKGNDFSASGLPGWDVGVGAIFLTPATENNIVKVKTSQFPSESDVCNQILDESISPENPAGNNKIKIDGKSFEDFCGAP